jgi:ribosome biogenesis GTPase A
MVRVRYSFGSRHTGKLDNIKKQRKKFPKVMEEVVRVSDVVLEVLDARFIDETRNFELEDEIKRQGKEIIFVLNKADLVDRKSVERKLKIRPYIFVSCAKRQGGGKLRDLVKRVVKNIELQDKHTRYQVGIVGYPNTGKSSLINFLSGRAVAKTGNEAGFTKGMQKVKLTSDILILDTPGVIPTTEYSLKDREKIAKQARIGARSESKLRDPEFAIQGLLDNKRDRGLLEKYYSVESGEDSDDFLEKLGRERKILKKGGVVDLDKVARLVLRDWQDGKVSSS